MSSVNLNQDICNYLNGIAKMEKEENSNMHRYFAYSKAAKALAAHDKQVTSGKEAQKCKGVGPKVAVLIDEYLSGGGGSAKEKEDGDNDDDDDEKPVASSSKKSSKKSSKDAGGRKHKHDDDDDSDDDGGASKKKKAKKSSDPVDSMRIIDHYQLLYMDQKTALGLKVKEKVDTVGQLREEVKKEAVELTSAQEACLKHIADLAVPIAGKEEVEAIAKELKKRVKKALGDDQEVRLTVCGAYRRGDKLDSSLSVLLAFKELNSTEEKAGEKVADALKKVLAALKEGSGGGKGKGKGEGGMLKYRLDDGKSADRFEALIQLNSKASSKVRRLRLRLVPADYSIGALFEMTGSQRFVESIVFEALERRYSLDENGLRKLGTTNVPGQLIPLKSEEELFEFIERPYVKPEERN